MKGGTKPMAVPVLKKKLYDELDSTKNRIIQQQSRVLQCANIKEQEIENRVLSELKNHLQFIENVIDICVNRNKF